MIVSSDPGEELDDLLAFSLGIMPYRGGTVHVVVSAGRISPPDRLKHLAQHLGVPELRFNERYPEWDVVFYADGDAASLALLPLEAPVFVNNGPLTNDGLAAVAGCLAPNAALFLVGSSDRGRVGGINQSFGSPGWVSFVESLPNTCTIVDVGAEVTRRVRFPNNERIFPTGSAVRRIAARSVLMFMASRPLVPARFAGLTSHIRINASNSEVCALWRAEAALPVDPAAAGRAAAKSRDYVAALRSTHGAGGGKGDTTATVDAMFALCAETVGALGPAVAHPDGGVALAEEHWEALRRLALGSLELTFDIAALCGVEDPYAEGKFGFPPDKKMDPNPGDVFASTGTVDSLAERLLATLKTLTPAYDLLSVRLAAVGHTAPLSAELSGEYSVLAFGGAGEGGWPSE